MNTEMNATNAPVKVKGYVKTEELIELGKSLNWKVHVLGKAPVPVEPIPHGDWLLVPYDLDVNQKPESVSRKIKAISDAGLKPRAYVILHEIPKDKSKLMGEASQVASPVPQIKEIPNPHIPQPQEAPKRRSRNPFGSILSWIPIFFLALFLIDPILVAITEDYTWVELERWYS